MSRPMLPSVLIIGFGAFGRLLATHLASHLTVAVCDPAADPGSTGLPVVQLSGAGAFDIVVLAVPVPAFAGCLRQIAPHLRPGQIVIDTCSIKQEPARLMQELLPPHVQLLGCHPMFGPQSARPGLAGQRVVLCPLRGSGWWRIAAFLRHRLRLQIVLSSPEEHDRHAALTQGLTHLLAHAMRELAPHPKIRTRSFDLIMEGLGMVGQDAPEVFDAVTRGNPHMPALRQRLAQLLSQD
ncbi:prephenate dehydrogenase [Frigidibacter sp.]|uniref:prephenate dehydrogenase n=1 Tax=Frigidibacter sp. TaxID=2586418 RepID=UPI002732C7EB|nr:prephenate dehydrogenase [Frigidibacter sp.]MDP3342138.1 prephenate dehydrogenase [Frigidibacter sp.]